MSVPRRIAFAVLIAAVTAGCRSPRAASPEPTPTDAGASRSAIDAPSAKDSARTMAASRVAPLAEIVSTLRGHPFKRAVPAVRFVARDELPTIAGANDAVTQVRVSGRYVPERHEILIADDLETSPNLESTVVHELVHALQADWGLSQNLLATSAGTESLFAQIALVEGDANLVEEAFRVREHGRPPRRSMASMTRVHAPWVPLACRSDDDPMTCSISNAINREGLAFASALYRAGGAALVDAAHAAPPTTWLEILFPDLYFAGIKERSLEAELAPGLAKANLTPRTNVHAGAFRIGVLFGFEVPVEILRELLHELRGDAVASFEGVHKVILTEWSDEPAAARAAAVLGKLPTSRTRLVGNRRMLLTVGVEDDVVSTITKHLAPPSAPLAPKPPLARAVSSGPPPWEEELASAVRAKGSKAFSTIGIDVGKSMRNEAGTSSVWLLPKDEKLFVLPTTAPVIDRKLIVGTLEKAWSDKMEGLGDPSLPEETPLPVGAVRVMTAAFAMPSLLHVAIARVPICGDAAASLLVLKFGADASVKDSLKKDLEGWRPAKDAAKAASLCERIRAEATELPAP